MVFVHFTERPPSHSASVRFIREMCSALGFDLTITDAEVMAHICDFKRLEEEKGKSYETLLDAAQDLWIVLEPKLKEKRRAARKAKTTRSEGH